MGVGDDQALSRLAEHLAEVDHSDDVRVDQILEDVACPHRGELIWVPHQDQLAAQAQGLDQRFKQLDVHHGHLIHHHCVKGEGVLLVALKFIFSALILEVHLQQPVDGLGLPAGDLAHPLGGPAGGGGQGHLEPPLLQ